jgi:putative polyketide hydroxylase
MDSNRMGREAPVLVVGAGPAGLVTAIGLARLGVRPIVVERGRGVTPAPRGNVLGTRTAEILRCWSLEDQLRALAVDAVPALRSADTLADAEDLLDLLPRTDGPRVGHEVLSPTAPIVVGEDVLESMLRAHLQAYGVTVVSGLELASLRQDRHGVTAVLAERRSRRRLTVQARYVVGADADGARLRALANVVMDGPEQVERYVGTLFRAPLAGQAPASAQYAATAVLAPEGVGIFQPMGADDRWLFSAPRPPWLPSAADDGRAARERSVRATAGVRDLDLEVLNVSEHSFAAQVAERYRVGRAFLAGEAAHRVTPRGASNVDAAVEDGYNLAWKLAFVLGGWAGDDLLDTYESERRPSALAAAERALGGARSYGPLAPLAPPDHLGDIVGGLPTTYASGAIADDGTDPDDAAEASGRSARPGARAPHLWLGRDGDCVSTVDLFDGAVTLLLGSDGDRWRAAAAHPARGSSVPVRTYTVGAPGCVRDPRAQFAELYGIDPDGAVLVRPDGIVAWRARTVAGHNPAAALAQGLSALTGRATPRPSELSTPLRSPTELDALSA